MSAHLERATSIIKRGVALLTAALILCPPQLHAIAWAKPNKKTADAEVVDITHKAEALLNKLEYERARELLESSVRDPQYRKAKSTSKAKLWALLGRARAELGDPVGTDEAFLQAVQWDRRVKLAKSTSPKILDA